MKFLYDLVFYEVVLQLQTVKISRAEIGHLKTYRDMLVQVG